MRPRGGMAERHGRGAVLAVFRGRDRLGKDFVAHTIERMKLVVQGRPAVVHCGGTGSAIVLVHGGWGGSHFHWSNIWSALSARHRVIAPELPGLGAVDQQPLSSVAEYAGWLRDLLDVLGVDRAWCVGNSFGASVVWSLGGRAPRRCLGLVLVNGFPMPRTPRPLRFLGNARAARALMGLVVRRVAYNENALKREFHDVSAVPAELYRIMATDWKLIVPRYVDILVAGDDAPQPTAPTLLLWGAADQLPGTRVRDAERLRQHTHDSTIHFIKGAGHFPQIEAPTEFVQALETFAT